MMNAKTATASAIRPNAWYVDLVTPWPLDWCRRDNHLRTREDPPDGKRSSTRAERELIIDGQRKVVRNLFIKEKVSGTFSTNASRLFELAATSTSSSTVALSVGGPVGVHLA